VPDVPGRDWRHDIRGLPVLVLRGGIDRERSVSLKSGAAVAAALREAGADVTEADVTPDDTTALDAFRAASGEGVVFPALHGPWGEGGGMQRLLELAGVRFVGCSAKIAKRCMDKVAAKAFWDIGLPDVTRGVPTPRYERVHSVQDVQGLDWVDRTGAVAKPLDEGSSYGLQLVDDRNGLEVAVAHLLTMHPRILIEQRIRGKELTVGIVGGQVLPTIWIRPGDGVYDFASKYERSDTAYCFDLQEDDAIAETVSAVAWRAAERVGTTDLCRVDLMLGADGVPWVLEVNTMPGFTDHSLLPMAAARHGWPMPELCARLVLGA
jgi:D-alanine-D-alanine ligase